MRVVTDGQSYMEHDSTKAVEVFLKEKNRERSCDANRQKKSNDDTSKNVKKYKAVQKTLFELRKN